jgi:hypothetical protein
MDRPRVSPRVYHMGLEIISLIATDERRDLISILFSFLCRIPNFGRFVEKGGDGAALPAPMQGASLGV